MANIRLDMHQLAGRIRQDIAALEGKAVAALRNAADRAHAHVVDESMEVPPADQSVFAGGWNVRETSDGAVLENLVPYAGVVEMGSRPHWPPFYPIFQYIARKRGVPTSGVLESSYFYDLADQPIFRAEPALETIRQIAVAVCRRIAEQGTPARYIMRDALPTVERIVDEEMRRVLGASNG